MVSQRWHICVAVLCKPINDHWPLWHWNLKLRATWLCTWISQFSQCQLACLLWDLDQRIPCSEEDRMWFCSWRTTSATEICPATETPSRSGARLTTWREKEFASPKSTRSLPHAHLAEQRFSPVRKWARTVSRTVEVHVQKLNCHSRCTRIRPDCSGPKFVRCLQACDTGCFDVLYLWFALVHQAIINQGNDAFIWQLDTLNICSQSWDYPSAGNQEPNQMPFLLALFRRKATPQKRSARCNASFFASSIDGTSPGRNHTGRAFAGGWIQNWHGGKVAFR